VADANPASRPRGDRHPGTLLERKTRTGALRASTFGRKPAGLKPGRMPFSVVAVLAVEWYQDAACAGMDTELFFPERGGSTTAARAVCASCTVRDECLAYALEDEDAFSWGVWGGTVPKERRAMRRSAGNEHAHSPDRDDGRRRLASPPARPVPTRQTVAELLSAGCSQSEIARRLQVSRQAVSQHVARLPGPPE
jgi:WhiB family redox-sensing transcriptional regulator